MVIQDLAEAALAWNKNREGGGEWSTDKFKLRTLPTSPTALGVVLRNPPGEDPSRSLTYVRYQSETLRREKDLIHTYART